MAPTKLTLANLGGGELVGLVDREIAKLCENIADPSVQTDAVRTITVKIKVKPDPKGQMAAIKYAVQSSLPGADPGTTTAYIAMAPGTTEIALFGADVRQQDLFNTKAEELTTEIRPVAQTAKTVDASKPATYAPPLQN